MIIFIIYFKPKSYNKVAKVIFVGHQVCKLFIDYAQHLATRTIFQVSKCQLVLADLIDTRRGNLPWNSGKEIDVNLIFLPKFIEMSRFWQSQIIPWKEDEQPWCNKQIFGALVGHQPVKWLTTLFVNPFKDHSKTIVFCREHLTNF